MSDLDLTAFIQAVRAMREAQRVYFKQRTKDALLTAKEAEKRVDALLAGLPGLP